MIYKCDECGKQTLKYNLGSKLINPAHEWGAENPSGKTISVITCPHCGSGYISEDKEANWIVQDFVDEFNELDDESYFLEWLEDRGEVLTGEELTYAMEIL